MIPQTAESEGNRLVIRVKIICIFIQICAKRMWRRQSHGAFRCLYVRSTFREISEDSLCIAAVKPNGTLKEIIRIVNHGFKEK